jgi:hypothetical protein
MLRAIAIVFAAYGAWSLLVAVEGHNLVPLIIGFFALLAAAGLWFRKSWSQYIVYVLSVVAVVQWGWYTIRFVILNGWPYNTTLMNALGLIPGLCMCAFCVGACIEIFRRFRVPS